MYGVASKINTRELELSFRRRWYYIQKIMGIRINGNFPALTLNAIWDEIMEDPEYKKKD